MTETMTKKRPRISTVEFWRLFFTVFVCTFHLEVYFMSPVKKLEAGTGAVEFFFILAGFTLAMSAHRRFAKRLSLDAPRPSVREASASALDYVVKKLKTMYPILVVVLLFGFVLYPLLGVRAFSYGPSPSIWETLTNSEWEWLMLIGTPFGFDGGNAPIVPMWFLTHLFIIGYLYTYALERHYEFTLFLAPVIGILGYIFFTLNSSLILDFDIKMGFLNAGSVHAIAEMALGISMYRLYTYLAEKDFRVFGRIILTLVNAFTIYRIFALTINQPQSFDNFRKLPYLMLIVLLSFLNEDYISKLLNRSIWRKFGHVTFVMYLCHLQLVAVYMQGLNALKMRLMAKMFTSSFAKTVLNLISDTGGMDKNFRPIPITWKDIVLYILLVFVVSHIILAILKLIRFGYGKIKPRFAPKAVAAAESAE